MWPTSYAKRVAADLETWVARGWVSADNSKAILTSLNKDDAPSKLPVVITILGAVLIGFSAMAFVAANWAEMSKALRLGMLAVAMWTAYGSAAFLHVRNQAAFSEAALLVGVAVFGASIMLIGQMYHLPADFSAGLLAWALGGLVTAWAVQSRAALAATQLLIMGWAMSVIFEGDLHLSHLLLWAPAAVLAYRLDWAPAKHLALIGLFVWLLGNAPTVAEDLGWNPPELLTFLTALFVLLWVSGTIAEDKAQPFGRALQGYSAFIVVVMFWLSHIVEEGISPNGEYLIPLIAAVLTLPVTFALSRQTNSIGLHDVIAWSLFPAGIFATGVIANLGTTEQLMLIAPLFLGLCIWLITFGTGRHNRFLINLGFAAFGCEALYLYLETFGTLLDTAAFFAIGGILLIAGGFVWERLRRRATATQVEASS